MQKNLMVNIQKRISRIMNVIINKTMAIMSGRWLFMIFQELTIISFLDISINCTFIAS